MANINVKYLGLDLKSPIIVGSCGLTNSIENLIAIEKNGAGAVVLKSIFEEQIMHEANKDITAHGDEFIYTEAIDYIKNYTQMHQLDEYIKLVKEAKKALTIPVIASINCGSAGEWVNFAKEIQAAGANAIELNIFILPTDVNISSEAYENQYFKILESIKKVVTIPIAIKTSVYFSSFAKMMVKLSWDGANGLVLFNRFYSPDIDIYTMKMASSNVYSKSEESGLPLRWIGILTDKVKCDLCASTGIHDGATVVKQLLAGASAVQIASVLYKNGFEYIQEMNSDILKWMNEHNYKSIDDFKGKMSYSKTENPAAYQRIQFMKYFSGIE